MAGIGFRNDPVDGGCVYVSTFGSNWIWRYRVHEPLVGVAQDPDVRPSDCLFEVGPNPTRSRVSISYTAFGPADIRIFDVNGRPVRSLGSSAVGTELRHATWGLDDDHGRPVASGVYFCELLAAGTTLSRKLVVRR
jgi:hypothetical protein